MSTETTQSMYDKVGGHDTFVRLVDLFYAGVAGDEELRAMYPEEDLTGAKERLRLFLEQYWGGPKTYSETRGHPRLRMRHAPFAIGYQMRNAWLIHMRTAMDHMNFAPDDDAVMWDYFLRAAHFMVNHDDGSPGNAEHPGVG